MITDHKAVQSFVKDPVFMAGLVRALRIAEAALKEAKLKKLANSKAPGQSEECDGDVEDANP